MAFAALLQDAEAVRPEIVRVIDHVVARIVDSERAARFHNDTGRGHRCCAESRRARRLRRHRGWRRRLAKFLDADQNIPLMEFIFYAHILQQNHTARFRMCSNEKGHWFIFQRALRFRFNLLVVRQQDLK